MDIDEAAKLLFSYETWQPKYGESGGDKHNAFDAQEVNTASRLLNDYAIKGGDVSGLSPVVYKYTTPEYADFIASRGAGQFRHALPALSVLFGGLYGVFGGAATATTSTTAMEASTVNSFYDVVAMDIPVDAAVASNTTVTTSPSFWDRMTGLGERTLEYGIKTAITKEIFGENQQPISTRATAGATPLNNTLPSRGFADSMPNFKQADMSPFIWIAAAFGLVLVLILGFSRR